jgi:hypothetical protein
MEDEGRVVHGRTAMMNSHTSMDKLQCKNWSDTEKENKRRTMMTRKTPENPTIVSQWSREAGEPADPGSTVIECPDLTLPKTRVDDGNI